jgi:hypothetical protein
LFIGKRVIVLGALFAALLFCFTPVHADSWSDSSSDAQSSDAKSPPPNLAGSWSGSLQDNQFGAATLSMDITQTKNKKKIGGTFDIEGIDTPNFSESGTVANGSVNGNQGKVTFNFKVSKNCAPKVKATLSNGNTMMTGSYFQKTKHCKASGTFTANLAP